ncbi:MAG: hypothetical protein HDT15_03345 [Oscillibacter sp.]|nr:hypothetical protein [Oscillibacter sp.]MBD5154124.1 hypothetical protein [Oscillibacter sp.]
MSKVVMSLPEGMVKNCLIGGAIALVSYVLLQMLCALLVDQGVLGLDQIYPLVCVTAALASFLGCGYSVLRGKGTSMLPVPVVVVVFLSLTLTAALLTTDAVSVENGLTGLGLSMAAGGLLAALVGYNLPKGKRGRTASRRKRRK